MIRRVLPGVLAFVAVVADGRGAHGIAVDALVCSIPFAAVAGLEAFGAFLEAREDAVLGAQAVLWAVALGLLVASSAARSSAAETSTLPALGSSALMAAVAVFAVKACLGVVPLVRRAAFVRPAKP
ncbi:MAG TPA: hypothetical protein VGC78_08295 [Gaiellaceae bacterium]